MEEHRREEPRREAPGRRRKKKKNYIPMIVVPIVAIAILTVGIVTAVNSTPESKPKQEETQSQSQQTTVSAAETEASSEQSTLANTELRSAMVEFLSAQVSNKGDGYIKYINAHSDLNVDEDFPWCAVFAWSALDQFASKTGRKNPIQPVMHVTDFVLETDKFGAHHFLADNDYVPKPGDLFTTSAMERPEDDYRDHIGYVESVELDEQGNLLKVHTIEGNFAWEVNDAFDTYVWRSEWVPGEHNEYGSALCEFLDLEKIFGNQ